MSVRSTILTSWCAGGVLALGLLAACGAGSSPEEAPAAGGKGEGGSSGGGGSSPDGVSGSGTLAGSPAGGGGLAGSAGSGPAEGGSSGSGGGGGGAAAGSTGAVAGAGAGAGGGGGAEPGGCAAPTSGHFQLEDLDRGVVAVKVAAGVYVGWRMQGYEYDDDATKVVYDLFRDGAKLATVTDSTNYLDASGTAQSRYTVRAVIGGSECAPSAAAEPWAQPYRTIPLTPPATGPNGGTYSANDASVGDLDGDGQLDIVLKWDPSNAKDNSQAGKTDDVFVDGYTLAGTRLFRLNLGPNIRAGAHYTQLSVYDFDGDGRAEIACKTAPGTKDGTGKLLSLGPAANDDDTKDYRNADGYVLTGPEYLTVFEGATGKELATVDYPVPRGTVSSWGDSYGNRVDRFNGGVAFVSDMGAGKTASGRPSIIQGRGYYTRLTVSAYNFREGKLTKNWIYDSKTALNADGMGAHSEMAIDADGDGAQEVVTGAATISSDGMLQCQTNLGHGDAIHVGKLIVDKPPAVFTVHEGLGGYDVHDVATCSTYVKVTGGDDNGRGVADYVMAGDTKAASFWSATFPDRYAADDGRSLGKKSGSTNFLVYWDADELRELEDGTAVTKPDGTSLLSCAECASNNGTKSTPTLTADLFGDWREEVVWRQADNKALRIYTTTAVTKRRLYTLMHDPTYRAQVAFQQSAYNQPPHVGFHIGPGMKSPPKPNLRVVPRGK